MSELTITGKLIKLLEPVSGEGKNGTWIKQEGIIETSDQYPKKICFSAWNDLTQELAKKFIGEDITIHFNIESREHNERWYTEVKAWKIN